MLWRIHASSALLIVPQFTIATFALVFLVDAHGWHPETAGRMLAIGQIGGAAARLTAGWWSDRSGRRMRPMRTLAVGIAAVIAALAVGAHSDAAVAVLLVAVIVTVSPNGLAFTAVAEYAGRSWAGRALGVQNAVAAATPPILAAVIAAGYDPAFATAAVFPLRGVTGIRQKWAALLIVGRRLRRSENDRLMKSPRAREHVRRRRVLGGVGVAGLAVGRWLRSTGGVGRSSRGPTPGRIWGRRSGTAGAEP